MALLLAALCETPGAEITGLFSLIQDPLHRYWVYSCSAHGGSSLAELSTNLGGFVGCCQLFPCTGVNCRDSLRSGAERGLRCCPGLLVTMSGVSGSNRVTVQGRGSNPDAPCWCPGV